MEVLACTFRKHERFSRRRHVNGIRGNARKTRRGESAGSRSRIHLDWHLGRPFAGCYPDLHRISLWREVDGVLYLQTKTGGRQVLDCKSGKMYEYPNAQHCPQSSQSDEVFENLEHRLRDGGCK